LKEVEKQTHAPEAKGEILLNPPFPKGKSFSSLYKREVKRDFSIFFSN
jgi:hypothetical protein